LSGINSRPDPAGELRRKAEEIAQETAGKAPNQGEAGTLEETQHLLHELQVHQIELELQNEELRQAEAQLAEVRARYFDLYDLSPVGFVTISEQELLLETNLTITTLLGVPRKDLIKQPFSRFVLREDQDRYYFLYKQLFETGEAQDCELRLVKKDGTAFWVQLQAIAVRDAAGRAVARVVINDITKLKQGEEKLRETSDYLNNLLDYANAPVVVWDPTYHITLFNHAFERLTGRSAAEVLKKEVDLLFPPEKREESLANIRRASAGERWETVEIDIQHVEGKVQTLLWNSASLYAADGTTVVATIAQGQDITKRKRAEAALRESESKYRLLVNNANEAIVVVQDGLLKFVNRIALDLLGGYSEQEIVNKPFSGFIHQEDRSKVVENYRRRMTKDAEQLPSYDFRVVTRAGLVKWVEINATRIEWQGKPATLNFLPEITKRKQAEEEAQRERAFFDRLVEAAPESIAIIDPQGRVLRVNAEFVRMFGYGAEEAIGQQIDDLVAPPGREEEVRAITTASVQGEKILLETSRRRKDGTLVEVSVVAAPIFIAGKQEAVYAIYRDITGRKQVEEQLRQAQKMDAIGQLAGGVAHDFNNLLTGILGNLDLMRSTLPMADPLLENLEAAETAARQAADLAKGLLTFGRSAVVLPVPMKITTALDATLLLLKQSLPATMELVRADELAAWNVLLDQSQMTQILLNLAVNARDAMKGKGRLTIRTRGEEVGEEYVQLHPFARTGEFVHLSVTDTGPGMSSEVMQHLFEPFFTTKPVGSGTGLGLSIVYGAVKQAGGWITAAAPEGGGATFDIYFPRCLEEPLRTGPPRPLPANVGGGTVLVVEDEPIVCAVAQALLRRSGYTVLTAPDGAAAVNILREHMASIGLVLLDMTMPGMTTDEIVTAIRTLTSKVPILLNSGYTSNYFVKQALKEGRVQGFLDKPYTLPQLLEKVQALLHEG